MIDPINLRQKVAHYAALVDREVRRVLDAHSDPHEFYGMLRYHLGWADERLEPRAGAAGAQGKGLRAALLLLMSDAHGGAEGDAVPLAAAVELLHNFSLIHDDIEDGSATRRHRPTLWSLWGAPQGINAGDGLYAIAHLALYDAPLRRTNPARFFDIIARFERTALHLCEGQFFDMTFESAPSVAVDAYLRMIEGKSAALIGAAAWMGAYSAGASSGAADAAFRFGRELGLAFQMQDDILGIWGDEAVTGKSAVSDIAARKKTLPVLLAMTHGAEDQRQALRELYAQRSGDDSDDSDVTSIMALLDASGAHALAAGYLQRHRDAALSALAELAMPETARDGLAAFALQFVDRSA